ncbi:putative late blight resistance protein homolog R1B-16 [Ipomoea triloba]|uniref:putative late blight resistance protein homolog R1B-16 n=1 Tax=Ipomoea triloba TaxID=35885 RepID=UPI00125D9585|nr:putative late blight resistance protein homolog R1B-16 [Ipomoea triloba]
MAFVALTSLIGTIEIEFVQPNPRAMLCIHDQPLIKSLLDNLSCLQAFLHNKSSGDGDGDGDALRDLEIQIRDFALQAEDDIEIQLSNFLLAKHTQHEEEEAWQELRQTLRKAAEIAAQIISEEKEHQTEREREREMICNALTSLWKTIDKMEHILSMGSLHDKDKAGIKSNLLEKLSSLQLFLHKESNGGCAKDEDLETKIKHFALKATDDIQVLLPNFLPVKDTESGENISQKLYQTMKEATQSAAGLLNIINCKEEIDDEANETQPSKHVVESDSDGSSSHGFLKPEGRMIGRHHDCTVIKDQLFSSRYELKIISIVGMVGIGKTALARHVYEDPSIASHFDVRGWVTIPQHYNSKQILSELLQSIMPEEPKGSTPDEPEMQVWKCLRGRKYLIVLDNIMSYEAWTDIRNYVPDDKLGSCILLTTRHFNLIRGYKYFRGCIHNVTLLDPKASWKLFCNILDIEEHLAPKFEKIRNHVVEKCDGLPQLIIEVAKRLSKCNNIQEGWKKIEKELESLGILDRKAIMVSYNMLPHHLKVCLLYFGVFPKRKKVLVKMLIRLWIAEGFVKPLEHKELEDQAYEYLQELIDRSLLLIEDRSCNGKIKTCRMHSALHSFCAVEAQKEGILCAVNTQQHSGLSLKVFANSCRWLSLYSHSFDYYVLFGTNIPRSIFFFHENPGIFVPPKLLRVLAFDTSISLQRMPVQLGGLVFLRYLYITQWFEDLNDVVSNNPNLETLIVSGDGAPTVHLPSSIWKPPHLKHIEIGNSYVVDPPSAYMKKLQTLSWVVRPVHCRTKMYSKFPNIKNLKILLKDEIDPPSHNGGCCSNPIILDHFDYFKCLEKLSISVSIGCNTALPELARYPSGLKTLKLSGTNISERDLNVIAKLPQLKVLKLENAFHGKVWEVAKGGFPELIFLFLEAKELKKWILSSWTDCWQLRHLVLRSCNCLKQIPKDLRCYNMESIELEGCRSSLVASVKQLQREKSSKNLKIKILGTESQSTDTDVSTDALARSKCRGLNKINYIWRGL